MTKDPAIFEGRLIMNEETGYGDEPDSSYHGFDPTGAPEGFDEEDIDTTPDSYNPVANEIHDWMDEDEGTGEEERI